MKKALETVGTMTLYQSIPDKDDNYTTFLINASGEVFLLPQNPKRLGTFKDLEKILALQRPEPAVQKEIID
jgi:hypothetical protein